MRQGEAQRLGYDLDVAAVPRNWQPPPAEPQARQPMSAAYSRVMSPSANRAPIDCTFPASSASSAGSVTPPGTITVGKSCWAASAIIMAGSPLSQVATPITPPQGERTDQPLEDDGRVVAIRQTVHHRGRALRAAIARIADRGGEGKPLEAIQLLGGGLHEQADLPVSGVIAQRDRLPVLGPQAPLRAQDQHLIAQQLVGFQPIPALCVIPKRSPLGLLSSISSVRGSRPAGPAARVATSKSEDQSRPEARRGGVS